jgi:hypothetical protein
MWLPNLTFVVVSAALMLRRFARGRPEGLRYDGGSA